MALVGVEISDKELTKVLPLKYQEENINAMHFGYSLKEEDLGRGSRSRRKTEFNFASMQPGVTDLVNDN